jgi:uncharacterized membrane protein
MRLKEHLAHSLKLQPTPSPWPRMILSALSVGLPLLTGLALDDLQSAMYGSLFGFILILNDHFGPIERRILHLLTTYGFLLSGFLAGVMLADTPLLLMAGLFLMAFLLGKAKGMGLELERMLLFTTLQFLTASQSPGLKEAFIKPIFYSSISLTNYIFCLWLVYLVLKHAPNFQKSKRLEFKEAWKKKESNRYALTLAIMSCVGLWVALYFHIERGYWIVGTILIVMMPDRYQSLYKSFQRLLGTFIGVVIASLLMTTGKDPWVLVGFCTFAAFFAPLGLIKNYWLGNVFIASLILFFLEISNIHPHTGNFDIAVMRLIDIGLGCMLGIMGTFFAFPKIFKWRRIKND